MENNKIYFLKNVVLHMKVRYRLRNVKSGIKSTVVVISRL